MIVCLLSRLASAFYAAGDLCRGAVLWHETVDEIERAEMRAEGYEPSGPYVSAAPSSARDLPSRPPELRCLICVARPRLDGLLACGPCLEDEVHA